MNQQVTPTQVMNALVATRPQPNPEWDSGRQVDVLRTVMSDAQTSTTTRRPAGRLWLVAGAAAVAAMAVVGLLLPSIVPTPTPAPTLPAQANVPAQSEPTGVQLLAAAAAAQPSADLADGSYLHLKYREATKNDRTNKTWEVYYGYDGSTWLFDVNDPSPDPEWTYRSGSEVQDVASPELLAGLPTDPQDLIDAVRPIAYQANEAVGGGPIRNNNIVADYLLQALQRGYGPSKVKAAMIQALPILTDIKVVEGQTHDQKPCIGLTGTDSFLRGEVACFDPTTSEWLETRTTGGPRESSVGGYFEVVTRETVNKLPSGAVEAQRQS